MAIAHATLRQLMQHNKCKTLFVTHYASVAQDLQHRWPQQVENLHMGYKEDILQDGSRDVVFLYKLAPGITTESFGVECGRFAGLPEPLLQLAASKSKSLRRSVEAREKRNRCVINDSTTKRHPDVHSSGS
jgi:DNA mismatch repair protein MSH3